MRALLAVALPELNMGPLNGPVGAELRPNRAMKLDRPTLYKLAESKDFLKGFALIGSSGPLEIVAVCTRANPDGYGVSIHTERVPERGQAGCADLVVKEIMRPQWDPDRWESIINAVIANIGTADAPDTVARLIDPSTNRSTG